MSLGRLAEGSRGEPSGTGWERARVRAPRPLSARGAGDAGGGDAGGAPERGRGSWVRAFFDDVVATVFPGECRVCAAPLVELSRLPVCGECLESPTPQEGALCAVCGEALGFEAERAWAVAGGRETCALCRRMPPGFERAVAYGLYDREMRALLHLFKYDGMQGLAVPLGAMLARAMGELREELTDGALVVPVPLFREKQRERGFNQTELLARSAVKALGGGMRLEVRPELLERVRATESQFGLNPRQRRENVREAFAGGAERAKAGLRGRDAVVVDDIYTTGATARACAAVLKREGARRVYVATLARAQPELVTTWETGDA